MLWKCYSIHSIEDVSSITPNIFGGNSTVVHINDIIIADNNNEFHNNVDEDDDNYTIGNYGIGPLGKYGSWWM